MGGNSMMLMLLIFVALMGVQMYLISKQNKKQRQQLMDFQNSLKPGDQIVLNSGIHGTIAEINDLTAKIEIAENTVITVERYSISRFETPKAVEEPESKPENEEN
jgi:preprotein translocase subunit YajC